MWLDEQYPDLDALEIPTSVGRRLDVGGFVFTDPFEIFLRKLSEQYLAEAWSQLSIYLERYKLNPKDLSWGIPHPGETHVPSLKKFEPHQFIGWTSQDLAWFSLDERKEIYSCLDEDLSKLTPQLRCVDTWRSLKWNIAPTDFPKALRLIEACCTDEGWYYPDLTTADAKYPWLKVIKAINDESQDQLDLALQEAKTEYSPLGSRIVKIYSRLTIKYGRDDSKLSVVPEG